MTYVAERILAKLLLAKAIEVPYDPDTLQVNGSPADRDIDLDEEEADLMLTLSARPPVAALIQEPVRSTVERYADRDPETVALLRRLDTACASEWLRVPVVYRVADECDALADTVTGRLNDGPDLQRGLRLLADARDAFCRQRALDQCDIEEGPGEPHGRYQSLVSAAGACVVGWRPSESMPLWARNLADGLRDAGIDVDAILAEGGA